MEQKEQPTPNAAVTRWGERPSHRHHRRRRLAECVLRAEGVVGESARAYPRVVFVGLSPCRSISRTTVAVDGGPLHLLAPHLRGRRAPATTTDLGSADPLRTRIVPRQDKLVAVGRGRGGKTGRFDLEVAEVAILANGLLTRGRKPPHALALREEPPSLLGDVPASASAR